MDLIEDLLAGNERYRGEDFTEGLAHQAAPPTRQLAVVACMDARHVPERVLGLEPGEAIVIRSAGAIVDEGVLRSLVAAVHLLGVKTVIHMPHTDCGLKGLRENKAVLFDRLRHHIDESVDEGQLEEILHWLQPFPDVFEHALNSVARIRTHALIPNDVEVQSLVYDNETGATTPVTKTSTETGPTR